MKPTLFAILFLRALSEAISSYVVGDDYSFLFIFPFLSFSPTCIFIYIPPLFYTQPLPVQDDEFEELDPKAVEAAKWVDKQIRMLIEEIKTCVRSEWENDKKKGRRNVSIDSRAIVLSKSPFFLPHISFSHLTFLYFLFSLFLSLLSPFCCLVRRGKVVSGAPQVTFGCLFEETANTFDALSGILKTAKKYKVCACEG